MNVTKAFIMKLFSAASMQRWNDKMRPMMFSELDKQSHKMIIAYLIAKQEEEYQKIDWIELIEGGIFELLQRIVLTDLHPDVFYTIKKHKNEYNRLNSWVYKQLKPSISLLGEDFCSDYNKYFERKDDTLEKKILSAAHFLATKWEFSFIERANPDGYEIARIKENITLEAERYYSLKGVKELTLRSKLTKFIDLCGELRFQIRWSTTPRVPNTSVLGHMLLVGIISYLFSVQSGACKARCRNNYYTGLFHDLPEVLTRDILSPIKDPKEGGLDDLIKKYEEEAMRKNVYRLLRPKWKDEIQFFTQNEFSNIVFINGKRQVKSIQDICDKYNMDEFSPRDGELVKAADKIAAFVEAFSSEQHGLKDQELTKAQVRIKDAYEDISLAGINIGAILAEF